MSMLKAMTMLIFGSNCEASPIIYCFWFVGKKISAVGGVIENGRTHHDICFRKRLLNKIKFQLNKIIDNSLDI